jgi:hypothetical protein
VSKDKCPNCRWNGFENEYCSACYNDERFEEHPQIIIDRMTRLCLEQTEALAKAQSSIVTAEALTMSHEGHIARLEAELVKARELMKIVKHDEGYWLDICSPTGRQSGSIFLEKRGPIVTEVLRELAALSTPPAPATSECHRCGGTGIIDTCDVDVDGRQEGPCYDVLCPDCGGKSAEPEGSGM